MTNNNPLSEEQTQQLIEAVKRFTRIQTAARVAMFNAWTFGFFAALSLLFVFKSLIAFVLGLGLGWVAWNEFKGKTRLLELDPSAAVSLGKNQILLMALIVGYACVMIYRALTIPIPELALIEEVFGPIGDLIISVKLVIYIALIALTVLFQGLNARYYFTRKPIVEKHLSETPEWILELQRKTAAD